MKITPNFYYLTKKHNLNTYKTSFSSQSISTPQNNIKENEIYQYPKTSSLQYYHPITHRPRLLTKDLLIRQSKIPSYKFDPIDINDDIPQGYKGIFSDYTNNIIGAGSIITNYLQVGKIMSYYSGEQNKTSIFDPKFAIPQNEIGFENFNIIKDINGINNGAIFIFSPTKLHLPQIKYFAGRPGITGVYADKPMCTSKEELNELERLVNETDIPFYFGDYNFFAQIPAIRLMGVVTPYKNSIKVQFDNTKNKKFTESIEYSIPFFKQSEIKQITAKINEKATEEFMTRSWLRNKALGGGVLLDLGVHLLNLLNIIGLEVTDLDKIYAVKYNEQKRFTPLQSNDVEDRVVLKGKINNNIPVHMEASQFMNERENYILIESTNGKKIKITTDLFNKKVELLDKDNNVEARAYTIACPYALMMHNAGTFLQDKNSQGAMFFDIQKKTMEQIFKIKDIIEEQIQTEKVFN